LSSPLRSAKRCNPLKPNAKHRAKVITVNSTQFTTIDI
jgi:hypothetical protein